MRFITTTLVLALTLVSVVGCAGGPVPREGEPRIDRIGPLVVTDMSGTVHELDSEIEKGRNVALVFWQTWCEPCKREAPAIVEAWRRHADAIRFFGVVPGPDERVDDDEVARVARDWGMSYPQVRDRDLSLSRAFEVRGTPTIIILGPKRSVLYRGHRPPSDWSRLRGSRGGASTGARVPAAREEGAELVLRVWKLGVMGTDLMIEALGEDRVQVDRAIEAAIAEMRRVEDLMTDWRASPLTRLNDAAGTGPVSGPRELLELIARGLEVSRLTDGAFDCTFAAAGRHWSFKGKPLALPARAAVEESLRNVGWDRVTVDLDRRVLEMPAGMAIGLGGIAKGHGVDRAMEVLMSHGIRHAMVNAGGDLKALGRKRGELWNIAIKHPRDRERVIAILPVANTCVVTSGDYARFLEIEGKRYHHIIDPRTGYPSSGCMSATVVAPEAWFADALATAMCVVGPRRGLEIVESLPRVEVLLVDMNGQVHVSSGLRP